MAKVKWIQFRSYAGLKIDGTTVVAAPFSNLHMERAYWLTAMLEAPRYGSVQSYDGAAMSGGPLHNIAVYPRSMQQGSLFPLLRRLELVGTSTVAELWEALNQAGWYIAYDGKLRDWATGKLISGRAIRNEFTPMDGKVPRRGARRAQAEKWIQLFHNLFADPATFEAQRAFAINYLIRSRESDERAFYQSRSLETLRVGDETTGTSLSLPLDFAMSVYHSHSVNGPTPAKSVLLSVLKEMDPYADEIRFARRLIFLLGKKRYGRWRDTADGKNRYDRTRHWARKSGLWPESFFTDIMPSNLPARWKP